MTDKENSENEDDKRRGNSSEWIMVQKEGKEDYIETWLYRDRRKILKITTDRKSKNENKNYNRQKERRQTQTK